MVSVSFGELKLVVVIEQRGSHSNHPVLLAPILLNKLADPLDLLDLLHGLIVNILSLPDEAPLGLLQLPRKGKLPQYEVDALLEVLDDVAVVLE